MLGSSLPHRCDGDALAAYQLEPVGVGAVCDLGSGPDFAAFEMLGEPGHIGASAVVAFAGIRATVGDDNAVDHGGRPGFDFARGAVGELNQPGPRVRWFVR